MKPLERGARIVVASHNPGKVWEIRELIRPYGLDAVSAADLALPVPDETEETFEGNALLKAQAAADASGLPALADDSGLEIAPLGGAPGVRSADWAGHTKDFGHAMQRVRDALEEAGAWKTTAPPVANFVSVLCLAAPGGGHAFFRGDVKGHIVWPPRGGNGFGYDPIFVPDGRSETFGEMEPSEKQALSHRARAFERFRREFLGEPPAAPAPQWPHRPESGAEGLAAAAANLSTRAELVRFISNLRRDMLKRGNVAESSDLARYLASMESWLAANDVPDEPRWRSIARALLAAANHE